MNTEVIEIALPEYQLDSQPDYLKLGKKVDTGIEKNLPDGVYVYRAISADDHLNLTLDQLVVKILELGTDKYDPKRKEVCFEEFCMYDHNIHAGFFSIQNSRIVIDGSYEHPSLFGDTIKKFYENALLDRGFGVRVDLLLIYDANKLEKAKKISLDAESTRSELEDCLYKFKDKDNKKDALVAIVKILR
ncbi:hypothetical protein KKG46_02990 [Patescibacteria group bacterium]|nr:hypothetical protein [Patescibacteria group bacterium]